MTVEDFLDELQIYPRESESTFRYVSQDAGALPLNRAYPKLEGDMAVLDDSMAGAMAAPDSPVVVARSVAEAAAWSPVRRIVFRLGFSYLALYLFTAYLQLLDVIPHGAAVTAWYENLWAAV